MAVPCEFGNALEESLHDCLVCGLANEAHQKCLLSEGELSLDKVLLIAQSLGMVEDNTCTLREQNQQYVNFPKVQQSRKYQSSRRKGKPHRNPPQQGMLSLPFCQLCVLKVSQEGALGTSVSLKGFCRKAEDIRCQHKGTSVDFIWS